MPDGEGDMLVGVSRKTDGDGVGVRTDEKWMVVMADIGSAVWRTVTSDTGRRLDSTTPVDSGSRGRDSVTETEDMEGGTIKLASVTIEVTAVKVEVSCTKGEVAAGVTSWRVDDKGRLVPCSTLLEEACTTVEVADAISVEIVIAEATGSWGSVLVGVDVPKE